MASKHGKWVPLLGEELARRVVKLGVEDAGEFCREAVVAAVDKAEGRRHDQPLSAQQQKCPHPESKRTYGRCRACGLRGLPEIAKTTGAKP